VRRTPTWLCWSMGAGRRRTRVGVVWTGAVAVLIVAILFAPLIGVGWCSDADETGTSVCGSSQRSVLGFETNVWVWLGAVILVVIGTVTVARSTAKRLN